MSKKLIDMPIESGDGGQWVSSLKPSKLHSCEATRNVLALILKKRLIFFIDLRIDS